MALILNYIKFVFNILKILNVNNAHNFKKIVSTKPLKNCHNLTNISQRV